MSTERDSGGAVIVRAGTKDKGTRRISASAGTFLFFAVVALGVIVGLAGYTAHRHQVEALEEAFMGRVDATLQGLEGQAGISLPPSTTR